MVGVWVGSGVGVMVGRIASTVACTPAATVASTSGAGVGVAVGIAMATAASTVAAMSGVGSGAGDPPQPTSHSATKTAAMTGSPHERDRLDPQRSLIAEPNRLSPHYRLMTLPHIVLTLKRARQPPVRQTGIDSLRRRPLARRPTL